jgi:dihydrofolate reductase
MIISLVVAAANNNVIGKEGVMPWNLPNDLKHFKNVTWGMPVVMGRKTFDSLGKPLAGRKNIVITRQADWHAEGAIAVKSIEDALFLVQETDTKEAMVIGGGEIFKLVFDKAKRIYLTRVDGERKVMHFFPSFMPTNGSLLARRIMRRMKNMHSIIPSRHGNAFSNMQ